MLMEVVNLKRDAFRIQSAARTEVIGSCNSNTQEGLVLSRVIIQGSTEAYRSLSV